PLAAMAAPNCWNATRSCGAMNEVAENPFARAAAIARHAVMAAHATKRVFREPRSMVPPSSSCDRALLGWSHASEGRETPSSVWEKLPTKNKARERGNNRRGKRAESVSQIPAQGSGRTAPARHAPHRRAGRRSLPPFQHGDGLRITAFARDVLRGLAAVVAQVRARTRFEQQLHRL